jgi:ATP-dependent RNA/DNA helicase IGHMBP2
MQKSHQRIHKLIELIEVEQNYERDFYRQRLVQRAIPERIEAGVSLYPLQLKSIDYGLGGHVLLELEIPTDQNASRFQNGRTLELFGLEKQSTHEHRVGGLVKSQKHRILQVVLHTEEPPEWLDKGQLGLDLYYDETTFREMLRALHTLRDAEGSPLARLRDVLLGERAPAYFPPPKHQAYPELNDPQNKAIGHVLSAEDVALIHGPPGTGKTTTLVAAICEVLEYESQVMVSAASNTAVDVMVRKLAAAGRKVVRLGHPDRMHEDIVEYTLEAQLEAHPNARVIRNMRREMEQLRKQATKFHRNFGPEQRQERRELWTTIRGMRKELRNLEQQMCATLLDQAEVIACTFVGSTQSILQTRKFDTVFIDEAAQALEPGCWIPLLRAKKVVMAGDHCQLPPTIKSPDAKALGETLFEHCIGREGFQSVMLKIQYRMNKVIMGFSSDWFYHGELEAAPSVAEHTLADHQPELEADALERVPLVWIDTAGCSYDEYQDPKSKSYANPSEAELLERWLKNYTAHWPEHPVSIGVIAPYRGQVDTLQNLWTPSLWPDHLAVDINTIDSYQGQERDLIVLSLVRSNDTGEIGFLKDLRRLNVAITRGRKQVVIIGDSATLGNHRFYQALLPYVETHGRWISAWEYMV